MGPDEQKHVAFLSNLVWKNCLQRIPRQNNLSLKPSDWAEKKLLIHHRLQKLKYDKPITATKNAKKILRRQIHKQRPSSIPSCTGFDGRNGLTEASVNKKEYYHIEDEISECARWWFRWLVNN